ncbi:hypothetical protein [Streptomonospora arabica]|uniref:Transposase DDE domain-containing protein n=1 Tax=Streptomonospora arabica TaxID=412417 RepID=A0ABV9SLR7_9ACTN
MLPLLATRAEGCAFRILPCRADYTHPGAQQGSDDPEGRELRIPNRPWTDGYVDRLGLSAMAIVRTIMAAARTLLWLIRGARCR